MAGKRSSPVKSLLESPQVREAAHALVRAVAEEAENRSLTPPAYARALKQLERQRGRGLIFPALATGTGRGARVRLADGTTRIDFIGGIGVYWPSATAICDLVETALVAAAERRRSFKAT